MHEKHKFHLPVYIKEMPRADGSYKHGITIGKLQLHLYRNPSGTFYYIKGLLEFLRKWKAKSSQEEACLGEMKLKTGIVIMAIAVDDFLVTALTTTAMDAFHNTMFTKYKIKRLGRPRRYLGMHFHYDTDGSIAISQRLNIDKTLNDVGMVVANGKHTP